MTNEEYLEIQMRLPLLAGLIVSLDLPGFLQAIDKAETLGPMLDPTLYRQASENMAHIKGVAEALNEARATLIRLVPAATTA